MRITIAIVTLITLILAAAVLISSCDLDLDRSYSDDDSWDWDSDGWCADLCDDVYDCGMDVRYYTERECRERCDSYNRFWDCIEDCFDQYDCRAQVCIDACSR
ncbi:MAG: hypothetical protein P9M14_02360 [Candidatus Alcyoniella australis]|nr:hypothetical protein [Candidatus Alcyoniella australis]